MPDTKPNGGPSKPSLKVPEVFGRYRIIKPLGQGGMGTVYLADDTKLSRKVALKIPHIRDSENDDVLDRFLREARAAATLDHPNLCQVFDYGQIDGIHFLAMAYIEGAPLSRFVDPDKPISERQAAGVIRKLALALAEAHDKGVIHRDLKPSNVMINKRREPIVMDFGLARLDTHQDMRLTQTGTFLGTPAYVSPEQIKGELDDIGPACDIYSMGVILYELLTGRLPFEGNSFQVLGKILTQEPEPPSHFRKGLDPVLESICLKAMAKDPGQRYPSMHEYASALSEYLRGETAGTERLTLSPTSTTKTTHPNVGVGTAKKAPTHHSGKSLTSAADAESLANSRGPFNRRKWAIATAVIVCVCICIAAVVAVVIVAQNGPKQIGQIPIHVEAVQPDTLILLDGKPIPVSDNGSVFELAYGEHRIEIKGDEFRAIDSQFFVNSGTNQQLTISRERLDSQTVDSPTSVPRAGDDSPPVVETIAQNDLLPLDSPEQEEPTVPTVVGPDAPSIAGENGPLVTSEEVAEPAPVATGPFVLFGESGEQRFDRLEDAVAQIQSEVATIEIRTNDPLYIAPGKIRLASTVTSLTITAAEGFTPILIGDQRGSGPMWTFGDPAFPTAAGVTVKNLCLVDSNENGAENDLFLQTACNLMFERTLLISGSATLIEIDNNVSQPIELRLDNSYVWNRSNTNASCIAVKNGKCTVNNSIVSGFAFLFVLGPEPTRALRREQMPDLSVNQCSFFHNGSVFDFLLAKSTVENRNNVFHDQVRLAAFHPGVSRLRDAQDRIQTYVSRRNSYFGMMRVFANSDGFTNDSAQDRAIWKDITGQGEMSMVTAQPRFSFPSLVSQSDDELVPARSLGLDSKSSIIWRNMGADVTQLPEIPVGIEAVIPTIKVTRLPAAQ